MPMTEADRRHLADRLDRDVHIVRLTRAAQLAEVLTRAGATSDLDRHLLDWHSAAKLAGTNPPSPETQRLALSMLPEPT